MSDEPAGTLPGGRRPNFLVLLVDEMRYPPACESAALKEPAAPG
jgi:hypothetical protein